MVDVRQGTIGRSPIIAIQAGKIVRVNEPPPAFFSTNLGPGTRWGTYCRSNDPKTSLVDRYHRDHDVPNQFVVDGSTFVTSASSG